MGLNLEEIMRYGWKILFKLPLVALAVGVMGSAVMLLWNWIVPALIAGVHALDFWHALGLLMLCRILFGGFHGRGGWRHRHHRHGWHALSRDERSRFRKEDQQ
jgi:uncharacterized membrane protein YGL010W